MPAPSSNFGAPVNIVGAVANVPINVAQQYRDVVGRMKVSVHQNIYEADFEYGTQPLRWEAFTAGSGTITQMPQSGGVKMSLTTAAGDVTIRQSRPYHRYQPGKAMFMATALNFGGTQANQQQRVGYFDDSNGVFFLQSGAPTATNPYGMYIGYRTDVSGTPTDVIVPFDSTFSSAGWNYGGDVANQPFAAALNWNNIQMLWIEYAWYGAGQVRWGCFINGQPIILHAIGFGNLTGQSVPWARTGNLPVRYEQRNIGAVATPNTMYHYGVSVVVEGRVDDQRGFTYSYGMALGTPLRTVAAASTRYPVLSIQNRLAGTQEYTGTVASGTGGATGTLTCSGAGWTVNQWQGRYVFYTVTSVQYAARILSNTATVLTLADPILGSLGTVTAPSSGSFTIGLPNRGQLLPRFLLVSSSALAQCELIASTPASPIVLTGASFAALSTLGAAYSFGTRDVSATAMTGGEVVMKFTLPAGGSGLQQIDLGNLFPLYNNIRGTAPDILTLAVSTQSGVPANVGADITCQEAMS